MQPFTWAELRDLGIFFALRALPADTCSAIGARLGRTLGRGENPNADAAIAHLLATLRPDLPPDTTQAWENIGRTFAEVSILPKLLRQNRSAMAPTALRAIIGHSRPPLIVTFIHLGNWEILGQQIAAQVVAQGYDRPMGVIMQPPNRAHQIIAARVRRAMQVDLLEMHAGVWRTISTRLAAGNTALWLAADDGVAGDVLAPAFNRPPRTDGNLGKIVRLAASTGALILPAYSLRTQGANFTAHLLPPIEIPRGRLSRDAIAGHVARLDALFAPLVREHLTQWYMACEFTHAMAQHITAPA